MARNTPSPTDSLPRQHPATADPPHPFNATCNASATTDPHATPTRRATPRHPPTHRHANTPSLPTCHVAPTRRATPRQPVTPPQHGNPCHVTTLAPPGPVATGAGSHCSTGTHPQPVYGNNYPRTRSPSPLRSGFKVDPETGEIQSEDGSDDDNDDNNDATWGGRRSHSPNPSISKFASSFAQRVGSFVSSVGSAVSPGLPTDEELEREAERDRERSRREAERILTREAEERRLMEEKVFAMLHTAHDSPKHVSPARSQSMPSFDTPSPTPSQRENGITSWWSVAKNRLTPTKEPLTAAQQVIQEAKEKEKREKKDAKKAEKDKKRSVDWPGTPENKYNNPTLLSLASPPKPSPMHAASSAPSSPTPGSQGLPPSLPASLAPSPLRSGDNRGTSPSRSPSRDPPPLYAQFNDQGTLDVPGTLLVIARRFEKLEKWTVGHVRALEERMSDVERWLVDKEGEKENTVSKVDDSSALEGSVNEMRDELMEMQGRIGELGREVAKLVTTPAVLSSAPSRVSAQAVSTAPQTNSSFAIHAQTSSSITVHSHSIPPHTPQPSVSRMSSQSDLRRRDSISPPFVPPSAIRAEQPRSRLPYPTGDYASPQDSVILGQGAFSPPQPARPRSSSISPTPRKRYTVALGEPIMKPRMSTSPPPPSMSAWATAAENDDDGTEEEDALDRTIGRAAGRVAAVAGTIVDTAQKHRRDTGRTRDNKGYGALQQQQRQQHPYQHHHQGAPQKLSVYKYRYQCRCVKTYEEYEGLVLSSSSSVSAGEGLYRRRRSWHGSKHVSAPLIWMVVTEFKSRYSGSADVAPGKRGGLRVCKG
ncbi:hypothetical protein EDB89DRAFT_2141389 [Lactarius sanguifluus]|nr:hypothetical protein EDB89DRAFT_2141389 [Lactarius sanguifluus]